MELLRDKKVEEQFHTLVKKFLTKNDEYDISRFKIESKAKLGIQIQTGLLDKKFQKRTKRQ